LHMQFNATLAVTIGSLLFCWAYGIGIIRRFINNSVVLLFIFVWRGIYFKSQLHQPIGNQHFLPSVASMVNT